MDLIRPDDFPPLGNHTIWNCEDPCYLCGANPPAGAKHNKDHVPPKWLYERTERPRNNFPTAPLCGRCKQATDPYETALKNELALLVGGDTALWSRFREHTLRNPHEKARAELHRESARVHSAWIETSSGVIVQRLVRNADTQAIALGVGKVSRGLHWVTTRTRRPVLRLQVQLTSQAQFLADSANNVRAFSVGPELRAVLHSSVVKHRQPFWSLQFLERVAFLVWAVPSGKDDE